MKTQKNLIVQLRVYKGQVNFDENGKIQSQNQLMKLRYGIREWTLFLNSIHQMGWTRVDVVKCLDGNEKIEENEMFNHPEIDTPDYVVNDIKKAMVIKGKALTKEQQEIKDLKDQMAELKAGKTVKPKVEDPKKEKAENDTDEKLDAARVEYEKVFGKKPHHKKTVDGINEEIKSKLAE